MKLYKIFTGIYVIYIIHTWFSRCLNFAIFFGRCCTWSVSKLYIETGLYICILNLHSRLYLMYKYIHFYATHGSDELSVSLIAATSERVRHDKTAVGSDKVTWFFTLDIFFFSYYCYIMNKLLKSIFKVQWKIPYLSLGFWII